MPSLIQRYLMLEILKSSAATTLILFVILMSNTLGELLSDISRGDLPAQALLPVLLGQSVEVLSLLLPLGLFLGVVFAFGRLYKDHELVVLHACGFGYRQLYKVVALVLIPVLLISVWISLWASSQMLQRAKDIVDAEESVHEFQTLKMGQFNESSDRKHVFFMQSMSDDRLQVSDLLIAQQGNNENVIETADTGRYTTFDDTGDLFLEVGPGVRYEGTPGQADYKIIEFEKHGILLEQKIHRSKALKSEEKLFTQLLKSKQLKDKIEMHWRIAIPVALLVLAMLAVPLSYIAPRQGRFGKVGLALLIFIAYLNLLGAGKTWLEVGQIPLWLNFWWVHLVFVGLTFYLLKQRVRFNLWSSADVRT